MEIIDFFREVRKLVVDTINPETLRVDPLPTGTYLSCGDRYSDIVMSAKLHTPIDGLDESIAFSEPKILSVVLDSPDYSRGDARASFKDAGSFDRHFLVSNAVGSVTKLKVLGGSTLDSFARNASVEKLTTQLVMPVSAIWKQQFEYWSKFEDGDASKTGASFFSRETGLSCLVGNYNFEHHVWSCDPGSESGFVSAISFRCLPMIKVLRLFPHVRRMSISMSTTEAYVVVKADGFNADYTFVLRGEVPHWYWAARLPVYEIDDPRSVMQQRQDES